MPTLASRIPRARSLRPRVGRRAYANSLGFSGSYRTSYCAGSVAPVADDGGMQRDYWYSVSRRRSALGKLRKRWAEKRRSARCANLAARKMPTCQVPVIFDPETAPSLVGHIFEAVRGDAIYRSASFLTGKLNQRVANERVTVLDDGLRLGGFGTRPFDGEGIASSVTSVH